MDVFHALADSNRRRILELLAEHGRLTASDISQRFAISASAISQHLKTLREATLVIMEKRAQQRIYSLNKESVAQLDQWIQSLTKQWEDRFDALDALLEVEKKKQTHYKNVKTKSNC